MVVRGMPVPGDLPARKRIPCRFRIRRRPQALNTIFCCFCTKRRPQALNTIFCRFCTKRRPQAPQNHLLPFLYQTSAGKERA